MVSPALWNTLRWNDPQDWAQLVALNLTSHDAIESALATSLGYTYQRGILYTSSPQDQLQHWMEHVTIAQLQAGQVPDISELTWDPSSELSFYEFLSYHAFYHHVQESAAGLS